MWVSALAVSLSWMVTAHGGAVILLTDHGSSTDTSFLPILRLVSPSCPQVAAGFCDQVSRNAIKLHAHLGSVGRREESSCCIANCEVPTAGM